jgi:hypothetical protein
VQIRDLPACVLGSVEKPSILHKFLHNSRGEDCRSAGFLILLGHPKVLHSPKFWRITGVFTNRPKCYEKRIPTFGSSVENGARSERRKVMEASSRIAV